ncbi:anti-sigma B factor RsbW [Paenibacillus athensensis]|uniref:Anti-sigma B factor RsbW n=1 Tax=Paenibacillus athensensis TaxID=1967502 RepID=A0A4Y8PYM6_9BACL|nr:anti-sigma B factor RsbW [Paenibacillus athensensis]MCD1261204.1 anti-sigma B factor RsbW [Paenibacillus athensensis]
MNPYIGLTIPAKAEYLDIVRLTLYGFATKVGFDYEAIEDMKVAVAEACNNSILHAYADGDEGTIELRLEIDGGELTITIRDHGLSFDPTQLNGSSTTVYETNLSEVSVGGLGLYLMQALMDDVQVRSDAGSGTEIVMRKRLERKEEMV